MPRTKSTDPKSCPAGKMINPRTNRCIKENGPTARKLGFVEKKTRGRKKKSS